MTPLIAGIMADRFGLAAFLIAPVVCYLWIACYGFVCNRPKQFGGGATSVS